MDKPALPSDPPDPRIAAWFLNNLRNISLGLLALTACGLVLWRLQAVLVPLALATAAYFLILPLLEALTGRFKMPRWAGALLLLSVGLSVPALLLALMLRSMRDIGLYLSAYRRFVLAVAVRLDAWMDNAGLPLEMSQWRAAAQTLPLAEWTRSLTAGLLDVMAMAGLTFILLVLMLGESSRGGLPQQTQITRVISRYLATKILVSLLTGVGTALSLWLMGLKPAFFFGVAAFFLNFIPYAGSAVAVALPLPVALLQLGWGPRLAGVVLLPFVVQYTLGSILEPRLLGRALGLNTVVVVVGLLIWGTLWGTAGVFMAVPILSVTKLIIEKVVPGGDLLRLFRFPRKSGGGPPG
jgi:AI-2 transport protein TqsA